MPGTQQEQPEPPTTRGTANPMVCTGLDAQGLSLLPQVTSAHPVAQFMLSGLAGFGEGWGTRTDPLLEPPVLPETAVHWLA